MIRVVIGPCLLYGLPLKHPQILCKPSLLIIRYLQNHFSSSCDVQNKIDQALKKVKIETLFSTFNLVSLEVKD